MPRQRNQKLTIADVAKHAGVGVGTVSRVLNEHPAVAPDTRNRIQEAMQHLGFVPNPHARRVAGRKSYTVSVILPAVSTEFYTRLLDGLERTLENQRYETALFPILSRERLERYLSSNTLAYQADGLVMVTHNLTELYKNGLPSWQPVVLVDARSPDFDSVFLDNVMGGQLAGEVLSQFDGPLHGVFVRQHLDDLFTSTVFSDRRMGFCKAAQKAKKTLNEKQLHTIRFNEEDARSIAKHIMAQHAPPYNIFAAADMIALAILETTKEAGLRVGQDVRIVGFDDHPWANTHGLSSVRQPVEDMGQKAAELLLSRLHGFEGPARTLRFAPQFIARQSTPPLLLPKGNT